MELFGKKPTLVGSVAINFYNSKEASVAYTTSAEDEIPILYGLVNLCCYYYAKMLFNLGNSVESSLLFDTVQEDLERILTSDNIGNETVLTLDRRVVSERGRGSTKTYTGELFEHANGVHFIQTGNSSGSEDYYAPLSVFMLLEAVLNMKSENSWHVRLLFLSLGCMHKYYREQEPYDSITSMNRAPLFGIQMASQISVEKS